MHKEGLHYHDTNNRCVALVRNVRKNEAGYSERQLKSAKLARGIYAKIGHPYHKYSNNLIKSNLIINCPVNLEDSIRADKIYGTNISVLKGKTIRRNSDPVVTNYITVPK